MKIENTITVRLEVETRDKVNTNNGSLKDIAVPTIEAKEENHNIAPSRKEPSVLPTISEGKIDS